MTLEFVSNVLGVVSVAVSTAIYFKMKIDERKQNEKVDIKLVLQDGSYEVSIPLPMLRKDISRAEVLGRLGMIPLVDKSKKFYSIAYMANPALIENIINCQLGKDDTIPIMCTKEEIEQFNFPKGGE